MRNYDYKSKMNQNRKRFAKHVGGMEMVATLELSTPVASNVISESGFQNVLSSSVVHAATENQAEENGVSENTHFSAKIYNTTNYRTGLHLLFLEYENAEDYKITWKVPEEFVVGLEHPEYVEEFKKFSFLSGSFKNEKGEQVSSVDVDQEKYITMNPSNRTIEFDLSSLLKENNLTLYDGEDGDITPTLLAGAQIYMV